MSEWIKSMVVEYTYLGIVFLMFVENVFPPIPSELIMPLAGFYSARPEMTFIGVVLAGTAGSIAGALPLYYLGRCAGQERLRRWCRRHGRWIGFTERDLDKAIAWFDRHGTKTVLLCRMIPGVRSLISIPAGLAKMPTTKFLVFTGIGSAAWAAALAAAGRALGRNYAQVEHVVGPISLIVVGSIVATIAFRAIRITRQERRERERMGR